MAEKLEFDLNVKNNQLSDALDSAEKKTGNLQSALNTALGVFSGGVALKGLELIGDAIEGTIDFAYESVDAYAAQEDAINRLAQSLQASGDASAASLEELVAFGDELGRTSKQSGEAILAQLAYAKSLGQTNEQAKNTVAAAAELSATFGGSLEQNVQLLGKSLQGTAGKLANYLPELKNLTKEQLQAGEAAEIINSKFGGAAAAELDSYTGRVFALGNAYEDIQKQVGGLIANSDIVIETQGALTTIFQGITQALADWRTESDRQNAGFKETETSVDQLKRKYEELAVNLLDVEQYLINPTIWDSLVGHTAYAKINIEKLRAEVELARTAFVKAQNDMDADFYANYKPPKEAETPVDTKTIDARKKLNDEILNLDKQLQLEQNNLALTQENLKIQSETERNAAEIERITAFAISKAELDYTLKEQEILRTKTGEDQRLELLRAGAEKELAISKAKNDGILKASAETREAEKKALESRNTQERIAAQARAAIVANSFQLAGELAGEGTKEQFFIQKAGALAQIAIADGMARALIPAQTATIPYPANLAAIAQMNGLVSTNTALGVATVAAAALKGFANGGIIGGSGQGATMGPDNEIIKARKGEIMLNGDDQKELYDAIKSGNLGGGDIIIQIDGDTIFKVVRRKVQQGYKLT